MITLTIGKKIKACRAILGMTSVDMSRECGVSVNILKAVENDTYPSQAPLFEDFINRQGLFFSEHGITTIAPTKAALPSTVDLAALMQDFNCDQHFSSMWKEWNKATRERFGTVIKAFADKGFDMWFVNMRGEIRIGFKDQGMERGTPLAFIRVNHDGFFLEWHHDLDAELRDFSGSTFLTDTQAAALGKHLEACDHLIPPRIKLLSSGRVPTDFL